MPTNRGGGIRGAGGVVAIPGKRFGAPRINRPNELVRGVPFRSAKGFAAFRLSGTTRNTDSEILGNCRVMIFRTSDNAFIIETTSMPDTGQWAVDILPPGPYFIVVYKAGSPDVCGTSVNTLTPSQV